MAKIVKRVAVVIKDGGQVAEGLRTTAGLLLENHTASLFVLDVTVDGNDKVREDLEFLKDMDGMAYSNVESNAERLGFDLLGHREIMERIRENDVIIPF